MSSTAEAADAGSRRRQARSDVVRVALLDAAIQQFAARGFDGASTRSIAASAGTHQPQINYHFVSKEALWRAAVDHLFARLDELLWAHMPDGDDGPPLHTRDGFAVLIRAFVNAAAQLPELNRIMVQEATVASDRLAWIVERHVRPSFEVITSAWRELRNSGDVAPFDEVVVYYSMVGAASLAYVNAAEAHLLGADPVDDRFVEAHADAVVTMMLGPEPVQLPS